LAQNNQEKTAHLTKLAEGKSGKLEFFSGDLSVPKSYDEAFAGADAIVHAAAVVEVWRLFTTGTPAAHIRLPFVPL
jgi:uncharacterized protein YbjT (DUF2867 family)